MSSFIIEWLGSGAMINPKLGNTSFLVRSKERILLVDCGNAVFPVLDEKGYLEEISDIIITHLHPDHFGSLGSFAFYNRYLSKRGKVKLHLASKQLEKDLWNSLKGMVGAKKSESLKDYFDVSVSDKVKIQGLPEISLKRTLHVPGMLENYSVSFGSIVFYSGDSTSIPINEVDKFERVFQDVEFGDNPSGVHCNFMSLMKISKEKRKKISLVHLTKRYKMYLRMARKEGFSKMVMPGNKFKFTF